MSADFSEQKSAFWFVCWTSRSNDHQNLRIWANN